MKPHARALVDLLENDPEGWVFSQFTATHSRTGLVLWISNGVLFFGPYENEDRSGIPPLGLVDRWRVWRVLEKCRSFGYAHKVGIFLERLKATP